jgi:hypothetical protein
MTEYRGILLYEYRRTFLTYMLLGSLPLGCLALVVGAGNYLAFRPTGAGAMTSLGIAILAGLGMPALAFLLWLLIPGIRTIFDPARQSVILEHRRPIGRWVKEYPVAEIADVQSIGAGSRTYRLALILRSGARVALSLGSTSDVEGLDRQAAEIKARLRQGS